MAENMTSLPQDGRLADIIRRIKIATAEHEDVVVDFKEADRARLEVLLDVLRPVIDEVPRAADQFDFAISSGERPRFWIDAVAHVHLGQDRRTYRLVRDTRPGRIVLAETADPEAMAGHVSHYIGERLVERERFVAGDIEEVRAFYARKDAERDAAGPREAGGDAASAPAASPAEKAHREANSTFVVALLWFILGCVAGGGILAAALWERIAPALTGLS